MTATLGSMADAMTEDEFLERENAADRKHEFINGQMVAMSGASFRHVAIVTNLVAAMHSRLRGGPCRALSTDLRVNVPATGLYTYPDVLVICGPIDRHPKDSKTARNPSVIVEVLSDSTEAYDRGAKFAHYRSIPSLRSYLLVDQHEPHVERFDRLDDGDWRMHEAVGLEGTIEIPTLQVTIPMRELYEDLPE